MAKAESSTGRSQRWRKFKRIFSYARDYLGAFVMVIVVSALLGGIDALLPWLIKLMLDADAPDALIPISMLPWALPLLVLMLFLLRSIFAFGRTYYQFYLQYSMVNLMRRDMVARIAHLRQEFHDREASGMTMARVMQYAGLMAKFATDTVSVALVNSVRLIGLLTTIVVIDWRFAAVVAITLPITAVIVTWLAKRIRLQARKFAEAEAAISAQLGNTLQGLRLVKAYAGEQREIDLLNTFLTHLRSVGLRLAVAVAMNRPIAQILVAMVLAGMLSLIAIELLAGLMTEGEVGTLMFAMVMLPVPLRELASVSENYQQAIANGELTFRLLDAEIEDQGGSFDPPVVKGVIEFKEVTFSYPDSCQVALHGLNLKLGAGEKVALVGPSGGGKTTIASLLLRLYDPIRGRISLDGRELATFRLPALRRALGIVTQDVLLFNATVAENVAYPARGTEIDRALLRRVLEWAAATSFVAALPAGEDTVIGERGLRLSGGERQRLSIARAFYKNAPVLILDEATSSLDVTSESLVREALERLLVGRTALIIAHRPTTVSIADRIVVIQDGQALVSGTHAELLANSHFYRRMHKEHKIAYADQG